ncbi:MAG: AbrB/MazE/SpoVT family DNA-binding domain-containing protein [Nitrospinota bacterium]
MSTLATIRISSRGQIVIPRAIREALGLEQGDTLLVARRGDLLILKKLTLTDIIAETDRQYNAGETLSLEEAFKDLV